MYKVLIVDDEDLIRKGLKTFAKWDAMGYEVTGEAADGDEAFDMILKLKPHVVLTDIKMPRCTGIELMKKIKESKVKTKIVVLSGYDEFEYARAALEAGAVDYLLKPIKFDRLHEVFTKIRDEYDRQIKENIKLNKAMELLKEEFFLKVADGIITKREDILRQAEEMNLSFAGIYFLTLIIEIDGYREMLACHSAQDMDLYKFAIRNIVEEICSEYGKGYAFTRDNGEMVAVFRSDSVKDELVQSIARRIKSGIDGVFGFTVTISVGDVFTDIAMLRSAYVEARMRADMKFRLGKDRIISAGDADLQDSRQDTASARTGTGPAYGDKAADRTDTAPDNIEARLLLLIQGQNEEELGPLLDMAFAGMTNREAIYDRFFSIIKTLSRFLEKNGISLGEIVHEDKMKYERVIEKETLQDIVSNLKDIAGAVRDYLNAVEFKSGSRVLSEVKEYVGKHLGEDITLETVARKVYMHPMYLSKLFKKETGINFIDYLTSARVEQAKRLMQDFTLKTYEISERVGYKSPKHFSRVFKGITGVTPKDYRRNLLSYEE